MRLPTYPQGAGEPLAFDGLFSTASEPQYAHLPSAARRIAHTSSLLMRDSGRPDISRSRFAVCAFWLHQRVRSATGVAVRKAAHDSNRGVGANCESLSGSG